MPPASVEVRSATKSTAVIKVGGARLQAASDLETLARLVEQRRADGDRVVVVHGGGPEIGALHRKLDVPFEKRLGLRVTSEASMPLVTMVLCGLVNKRVVAALVGRGLPAVGLCGVDLGLLRAQLINRETLGRVGGPPSVAADVFQGFLDRGLVPVVAPVALGADNDPVNVNADTAAHAIATALRAEALDFVSDVPGVRTAPDEVAAHLTPAEVEELLKSSVVQGGMIPKLQAALAAIDAGVGSVRVGDLESMRANRATEIGAI